MKKLFGILLAVCLLFTSCAALAENAENQNPEGAQAGGMMTGGWAVPETPGITDEAKAVFDKAMEGLLGVNYVPVVLLGTQVVAGANYAFLCQGTVVAPGAAPSWKIVYIYRDPEGSAKVNNIVDFDFGALYDYGTAAKTAE